tara:strand:+ start:1471 stop:2634 length:1164 start_codon:yes stop_codon:yes gene_type:complete
MSVHKEINLFSSASVGKTVFYHGSILPELNQGDYFSITETPSDEVYRIGHGASSVNLVNENIHLTLIGSSRLINDSFGEILSTIDEFETEDETYSDSLQENVIVGPMGPIGPMGPEGEQGLPGIPGRDGKDGVDGERGEQGEQGPQGERGEKGDRGEQGLIGEQGPQGEQGEKGLRGERGEQGDRGVDGNQGDQGPQGIQGERGEQGPQGDQGEQGPQGIQGERGVEGQRGSDGKDGSQGPAGAQGPKGDRGEKGDKGDRGERGEDGIANVSGPLIYDSSSKVLSVSEKWIESLGSIIQNGAIVGGGGDLLGVKKDGSRVPRGNAVRFIDFRGDGVDISIDGTDAVVDISHTHTNSLQISGGNNVMSQSLDMNGFDIYNARIDGGTF